MPEKPDKKRTAGSPARRKIDPAAAARALAEAEERRKARDGNDPPPDEEVGGRGGLEPSRYGDWEKDGIVSDF